MSKRRILIVTNRVPYPLNDGGALAMDAMIRGYGEQGWEVCLLSMNTSRHFVEPDLVKKAYPRISVELVPVNTSITAFQLLKNFIFSRRPNHAERFDKLGFLEKLLEMIASFRPEFIQLESVFHAVYIPAIRRITNTPVIIRLHNVEYQIWERLSRETANPLKKGYLANLGTRMKKFEIAAWKDADLLLPITEVDAATVRSFGVTTDMLVVPMGLRPPVIPSIDMDQEWVGYHLGAMDWLPNAQGIRWFLDKVWPGLHAVLPGFQFHFAGRNMPASFMQGMPEGVTCHGEVKDAASFLSDKKILIVPIHSGGGLRVKILEAMAAGRLVISTSVGMQGIPAQPGAHYLQANTSAEFIAAITRSLENKAAAEQIAQAGRQLILGRFDQRRIMSALIQKLDDTATATGRGLPAQ